MAWVGDAIYSLAVAIVAGATVNCPESPETVQRDLRELAKLRQAALLPNLLERLAAQTAQVLNVSRAARETSVK